MKITQKHIQRVEQILSDEMARRGLPPVKVYTCTDRHDKQYLGAQSENFQTTPVLFKSIRIEHFNSAAEFVEANEEIQVDHIKIWMSVHARYTNFSRGSNGVGILEMRCVLWGEDGVDDVRTQSC